MTSPLFFEKEEVLDRETRIATAVNDMDRLLNHEFKQLLGITYMVAQYRAGTSNEKDLEMMMNIRGDQRNVTLDKKLIKNTYEGIVKKIDELHKRIVTLSKKRKKSDTDLQNPNFVTGKFRDFVKNETNVFGSAMPGSVNADSLLVDKLDFPRATEDTESLVGTNTMTKLFHLYFKVAHLNHPSDPRSFLMNKALLELGSNIIIPGETEPRQSIYQWSPVDTTADDGKTGDGGVKGEPRKELFEEKPFNPVHVVLEESDPEGVKLIRDENGDLPPGAVVSHRRYYLRLESITQLVTKIHHNKDSSIALLMRMSGETKKEAEATFKLMKENPVLQTAAQADYVLISDVQTTYNDVLKDLQTKRNSYRFKVVEGSKEEYHFVNGEEGMAAYDELDGQMKDIIDDLKKVPREKTAESLARAIRKEQGKKRK